MVSDQSEARCKRAWLAAGIRLGKLPDSLDDSASVSPGDDQAG